MQAVEQLLQDGMDWIYVAQDKDRWWGFGGQCDETASSVGHG